MDKCKIHIPDGSMVSCSFRNCNISDGEFGTRGLSGVAGMIQSFTGLFSAINLLYRYLKAVIGNSRKIFLCKPV